MGNNKNADFYQIQANFNEYWKDKTPQKGQGYKVFKRWETWMAPRVFPSGNISLASTNYENYMRWKTNITGDRSFTPNDWSPLGPLGVPQGYDAASGRVDFVRFHPSDNNIIYAGAPDGGQTWNNRSSGLPNLPINAIVTVNNSPANEVYIGADLGIYYLDNGANGSWSAFNNNLPKVAVTDLEIFYPENKIRASTYGRGAWESEMAPPPTAAKEKPGKEELAKIYPNPSQDGWYNLELTTSSAELVMVEITNLAGRFISTSKFRNSGGVHKIHVPAPGVYLVAITMQDGKASSKKLVSFN